MTEILLIVTKVALLTFLLTSMFGMGLSLTVRQIIAPLKNAPLVNIFVNAIAAGGILTPPMEAFLASCSEEQRNRMHQLIPLGKPEEYASLAVVASMWLPINMSLPLYGLMAVLLVWTGQEEDQRVWIKGVLKEASGLNRQRSRKRHRHPISYALTEPEILKR